MSADITLPAEDEGRREEPLRWTHGRVIAGDCDEKTVTVDYPIDPSGESLRSLQASLDRWERHTPAGHSNGVQIKEQDRRWLDSVAGEEYSRAVALREQRDDSGSFRAFQRAAALRRIGLYLAERSDATNPPAASQSPVSVSTDEPVSDEEAARMIEWACDLQDHAGRIMRLASKDNRTRSEDMALRTLSRRHSKGDTK